MGFLPPRSKFSFAGNLLRLFTGVGLVLTTVVLGIAVYGKLANHPSLLFSITEFGPWKHFTRAIWVFLVVGFLIRCGFACFKPFRIPLYEMPPILCMAILIATLALFDAQMAEDSAGIAETSRSQARSIAKQVLMAIDDPTLALDRMASRWSFRDGMPEQEWRADVERMVKHFPGLNVYVRIDAKGIVRSAFPAEMELIYIGKSVYDSDYRRATFERARNTKALSFSKVIMTRMGKMGFGANAPIFRKGVFDGILSFGILLDGFIKPVIEAGEYRVVFLEDEKPFYTLNAEGRLSTPDPEQNLRWRGVETVRFRDLVWGVETYPLNSTVMAHASGLPTVLLSMGLLAAMLVGALARMYLTAREAQAKAHDAAARQKAIVDGSDLSIVSCDNAGIVRSFNPSAEKLLGYTADEVLGKVTPGLWHEPREVIARSELLSQELGRSIPPGFETLVERSRRGMVDRGEWTFIRKDGGLRTVLLSVNALRLENGDITGYVGIVEDLTQKKAQILKIAEQQALMLHSSKLASLGEMAAGVAHEINNPLLVISGKVEQMRRHQEKGTLDGKLMGTYLETIRATVDRIAKIVSGLRSFARDTDGEPMADASVLAVIEETVALCAERFRNNGIALEIVPTKDFKIHCRSYQIAQVLLNLLSNAFDAASTSKVDQKWVRLEARAIGGVAEISITDSGSGIPEELREKIMVPFFTTKEVGKGTGLGLSISQGIMADHGGMLALDPKSPHTRFMIRLPLETQGIPLDV